MNESAVLADASAQKTKHILVVEDNVALRFTLAVWLRALDYNVLEAASADEAMELLNSPLAIDFVVTDVQMPGTLNGFDLRRHINKAHPGLPVIVVSGVDTHQELREEPILFFRKPYDLEVITSHIVKLLTPFGADKDGFNE